jgi:pyruvate/2-oxoglutarate dehydrogenase complex dihydrolipoamide dehydrogenase (E3) component
VGGGPSGLEAARVASLRGHKVTLWEKDDALGGQLRVIALEEFKKAHGKLGKWYERQLKKLNVTIALNKKATEAEILSENPDVVILALGGEPSVPNIEGIDAVPVYMAVDVFQGKHEVKNKVVIIGGGLVGCELALKLAEDADREITVVEMLEEVASDMELFTKMTLTGYLSEKGVNTLTGSTVTKVMDSRILCVDMEGNQKELAFDNLILASGLKSRDGIYDKIEKEIETHVIGDGLNVSNIFNAVHDGFNIAMDI